MWADAPYDGRPAEYRWRPLRKIHNSIPCTMPQTLADASARVPCSNAANIGNARLGCKVNFAAGKIPLRGKSRQKCIYSIPVQEMAKHCAKFGWPLLSDVGAVTKPRHETCWNLLGCPKLAIRSHPLVSWSSPYCKDIWRRYCHLTCFFLIVDTCLSCEDTAQESYATVHRWRFFESFLHPVFPASRVQHNSHMHSKFALRPHHVWKYGRHAISDCWD